MSFNQSRSDKNKTQYRKTGRSARSKHQQRGCSPSDPKATGAGGPAPSISSNCRSKKPNNNAQGGQSRPSVTTVNPPDSGIASTQRSGVVVRKGKKCRGVQNGAHVQPQLHGGSVELAPVASTATKTTNTSVPQRIYRAVPKAPTSQSASVTSDTRTPTTLAKPQGDASKGFSFQFGSISPGFMNGMQIPARTSSAPANLDEQKLDQARHDSFRNVPSLPTPSGPKQQLPRKDPASTDQPNTAESHLAPKVKKDVQFSHAPPASQPQKPSALPMAGISMPMPFHQQQVSVQFGDPNQQTQSQGMSANSLQMPMPMQLPIGSTQVQQPVFVPGLQPHPMQTLGIMHQGQNMTFTPQKGPQVPQLGNLGIDMAPPYTQQQGGKFPGPRKTPVKITHPDTHKELRLDKRTDSYPDGGPSAPRTHPNGLLNPMPMKLPIGSTQVQVMHKAERKYEVHKLNYEEKAKQRQFKAILNKLTPQNFEKLFEQVKAVNIDNATTLTGVISQIYDKALMEPTFCEMYANICFYLAGELPDFSEDNEKITFKRLLLNMCQEEFERGEREKEEANKADEEGEVKQSFFSRKRVKARRRMLGNIRLIGELYKKKMLTERIMHECIKKLLGQQQTPDEEDLEALCKLMSSIGEMIDHPKAKEHMDAYFDRMKSLSNNMKLSSRVRFMLKDSIDLRQNKWQQRRKVEGVSSDSMSGSAKELLSDVNAAAADCSESKAEAIGEGSIPISSEISGPGIVVGTSDSVDHSQLDNSSRPGEHGERDLGRAEKEAVKTLSENHKQDTTSHGISAESSSVKPVELVKEAEHSIVKGTAKDSAVATSETAQGGQDQHGSCHAEFAGMDASSCSEVAFSKSSGLDRQWAPVQTTELSSTTSKDEGVIVENSSGGRANTENMGGGANSLTVSGPKDKPLSELTRSKSNTSKAKKKRKEKLSKAGAAGVTSDLYGAYKNPEEKKGIVSSENTTTSVVSKQIPAHASQQDCEGRDDDAPSKAEPDDREHAADISTPKLETSDCGEQVLGLVVHSDNDGHGCVGANQMAGEAVSPAAFNPIDKEAFKLGFIGAGNLASSVAIGLVKQGKLPASRIFTAHHHPESRVDFTSIGIRVYQENHQVIEECDVIIFAVKPPILKEVILDLRPLLSQNKLLLSLAVGHKLTALQEWAGHGRLIRVIPTTASVIGEAATVVHMGEAATADDGELIADLFGAVGKVWKMDEKLSDAASAIGGAGTAFVYIAIEAMADGGVAAGLPREVSLGLSAQAFYGAASMVMKTGKHPGQLKDQVASPGGTTIAGIHELEKGAFRASMMNAVVATTKRSHEMGQ